MSSFYTVPDYPSFPGLMLPIIRTPEWDTDVQISLSGKRTAYARRAFPRYRYELSYSILRTTTGLQEWQNILSFLNTLTGRSGAFVYTDQDDNAVTTQSFGTGDGVTTTFQLVRAYAGLSFSFAEPVFAIQTASIFVGGVLKTINTDYTIGTTGIVTFVSPPASLAALTWTGTYGWYCRMDEDVNQFEKFLYNAYEIKKVKFSTEVF